MVYSQKTVCSICKRCVYNIPRHLRQYHSWNDKKSAVGLNILNIRRKHKNSKNSYVRNKVKCPVENCYAIVIKIGQHLKQVHKLEKSSKDYLHYLTICEAPKIQHYHVESSIEQNIENKRKRYASKKLLDQNSTGEILLLTVATK